MYEVVHDDLLSLCIIQAKEEEENDLELVKQLAYLEANGIVVHRKEFEDINGSKGIRLEPFIENLPTLELKELLDHLRYAFFRENSKLLVIVALNLKVD